MSTGTPISSDGRLHRLPNPRQGAGYRLVFPIHEVTIDAPAPTEAGAIVFALRTDAPAPALPEGWFQRPFPAERPVYHFPIFREAVFAGTAPGVVPDPEPWEVLRAELGEAVMVFSAFLPPVTLGGLVRLLKARRGEAEGGGLASGHKGT